MKVEEAAIWSMIIPNMDLMASMDEHVLIDEHGEIAARVEGDTIIVYQSYTHAGTLYKKLKRAGIHCQMTKSSALFSGKLTQQMN